MVFQVAEIPQIEEFCTGNVASVIFDYRIRDLSRSTNCAVKDFYIFSQGYDRLYTFFNIFQTSKDWNAVSPCQGLKDS